MAGELNVPGVTGGGGRLVHPALRPMPYPEPPGGPFSVRAWQGDQFGTSEAPTLCPTFEADPQLGGGIVFDRPPPKLSPAVQELLRGLGLGPIFVTSSVPTEHPPYRARNERFTARVVLGPGGNVNAGAVAGAVALQTAAGLNNAFTGATLLLPTSTNQQLVALRMTCEAGRRYVFKRFGVQPHSYAGGRFVRVAIYVAGTPVLSEQEMLYVNPTEEWAFVQVAPNQVLEVRARNLDVNSGYLLDLVLEGYSYPIQSSQDTLAGTLLRDDYAPVQTPE